MDAINVPQGGVAAGVGIGMLWGGVIRFIENKKVLKFRNFQVSKFQSSIFPKFHFPMLRFPKLRSFEGSKFRFVFLMDIDPMLPKSHFMFSGRY